MKIDTIVKIILAISIIAAIITAVGKIKAESVDLKMSVSNPFAVVADTLNK